MAVTGQNVRLMAVYANTPATKSSVSRLFPPLPFPCYDRPVRHLIAALISVLPVLWVHSTSADVVELMVGERVEGVLKEATPAGVVIDVAGQSVRFEVSKVRAIHFGSPGPPPPAPGSSPPASVSPPKPPSPAEGVLQLIQSLRSAVAGGTTLREYEGRVNDTAPLVELYLAGLPPDAGTAAVRDAMRYYLLAEWAWSNQGTATRTVWLRKDDALGRCPGYQDFASEMRGKGEAFYAERMRSYLVIADGVISVLWTCASDKVAEAEKLLVTAK
jgi:hypothetical protein